MKKLREHFTRHEVFYHSIQLASAMIFVLFLVLVTEVTSK